ncbi:MAG: histidine kinase [Massilia sp.]
MLIGQGYQTLYTSMLRWCWWGLLAQLMIRADARLMAARLRTLPFWMAHAGLGLALSALHVAVIGPLEYQLQINLWNPRTDPLGVLDQYLRTCLNYCLIFGTFTAFKYYRRHLFHELQLERLERRFLETRLNVLRMQLDPHFLFNSLNGISAYVGHEPKLARKMIEHLSDLLRLSLASRNRQEVTLAEEISFLEHYFALHRMRYEERLAITVDIAQDVEQARIPSLLLQPLVENAIKHGIAGRVTGGKIIVSARRVDSRVDIRVIDDGVGLPPRWELASSQGLGLSVTRERLLAMYPAGACEFAVTPRADGGTEAKISLPLALAGKESALA